METTRGSLLQRIRDRRDQVAWQEFDAVYRPLIRRFAKSRGLDDASSEDVVQHCMLAVHRHIDEFNYDPRKGRFKGWLRTVADNRIRNLVRGHRDQPAETRDLRQPQESEETPEDAFDRIWHLEHLSFCLRRIRSEVQESTFRAFELHVLEEWPVERVAIELKMTNDQVYRIKWRVLQKLRSEMRRLLEEAEDS